MKNLKLFLTIILLFCIFSCNKKNEKNENVKKINDNMISNEITADKNNKNSNENTENVNIKSQKNKEPSNIAPYFYLLIIPIYPHFSQNHPLFCIQIQLNFPI